MKIDSAIFYTLNLERIVDFYQNKIGLKLGYQHGDKYASFDFEDGVKLGIKTKNEEREIPGSQTLIIAIEDIQSKYDEIKGKGIELYKDLTDETWGIHFGFLDPDGNKMEFVQRK